MNQFDTKMTALADAIKTKNENAAAKLSIAGMIEAVNAIKVGGGDIVLPEGVTVTPADVKDGVFYINSSGAKVEGTMPNRGTVDVTLTDNSQILDAGYYDAINIPASEGRPITFGYFTNDRKFQAVDLTGDTPVDSGNPIDVDAVLFETGQEVPAYPTGGGGTSSIEFYECASYTPNADAYTKYSFTLSGAPDELANGTYVRKKWVEDVPDTEDYVTIAQWINENGYSFIEEYGYSEFSYSIKNKDNNYIYSQESPHFERVTDYNSIVWVDGDTSEGVTLNFSAWQTEEVPATTEGWTGYPVTQNTETGAWSKSDVLTEGLTVQHLIPRVGEIFSGDTTIWVRRMYDGSLIPIPQDGLIFYAPLVTDYTEVMSKAEPLNTYGTFGEMNGKRGLLFDGEAGWFTYGSNVKLPSELPYTVILSLLNLTAVSPWRNYFDMISCKYNSLRERSDTIEVNKWYTAAVVVEANGTSYIETPYLNGVKCNIRDDGSTFNAKTNVTIGAGDAEGNTEAYLNGYVADAIIYNRALTADEILEIHNTLMEGVTQ